MSLKLYDSPRQITKKRKIGFRTQRELKILISDTWPSHDSREANCQFKNSREKNLDAPKMTKISSTAPWYLFDMTAPPEPPEETIIPGRTNHASQIKEVERLYIPFTLPYVFLNILLTQPFFRAPKMAWKFQPFRKCLCVNMNRLATFCGKPATCNSKNAQTFIELDLPLLCARFPLLKCSGYPLICYETCSMKLLKHSKTELA